ncbi:MAG: glycerophosphodiester phosphodiesterase family protein [Thermoprotei archaeon]
MPPEEKNVLIYGHRGTRTAAPENTLPAFKHAKHVGADGVELDIHLTSDEEIVVIHDDRLERTTNGFGRVRDHTFKELESLDAGVKFGDRWRGTRIPTLRQVFQELGRFRYKIELKHGSSVYPGIEGKLLETVREFCLEDFVRVTSFDYDALKKVRELDGKDEIEIGVIMHGRPLWFVSIAESLEAKWLQAFSGLVTREDVAAVHASGFKIGLWPIGSGEDALEALKKGADEITADDVDSALSALGRSRSQS